MSIIAWLIVGAIAGWIAEKIMGRNDGLLMNIIVGIVGAFLGGLIFSLISGRNFTAETWDLGSFIVAVIGAVILLFIVRAVTGRRV